MLFRSDEIEQITGLLLRELEKRCKDQLSIEVHFTDSVKKWLAKTSYDAKYGARPLKRAIQNRIEDRLADEMLDGKIQTGDHVDVKVVGEKLKINVQKQEA